MNTKVAVGVGIAALVAVVAGILLSLQNFDAEKVSCDGIDAARANLQSQYDAGVSASVQIFAEEKAMTDERLSQCLQASPQDPCEDAQKARDAAVAGFNNIPSPPDNAPYKEFQSYFGKRDDAYGTYKKTKDALQECRMANPPKPDVPYEQSDTKACFDAYDASVQSSRDAFGKNTQALKSALKAALDALDAREKACHPPTGREKFTETLQPGGTPQEGTAVTDITSCKLINADIDTELFVLRKRAAALPVEIQAVQASIDSAKKRMSPLQRDLRDVDTYIPPESAKTQFEGTLNALRAERKVAIESTLEFYQNLITRKQAEKADLENELRDVTAQIAARLSQIEKENAERQRNFPTAVHLAKPDKCAYYHCHGMICGRPDPDPHGCGQGSTTEGDTDCTQFINAYLEAAGAR